MKRLACILVAILIPLVCSGDGWFYTGAGGGGGEPTCDGCNTGTDSVQYNSGITQTSSATNIYSAWQFTVSSSVCVTGVYISCSDAGAFEMDGEIWSDSGGEPDSVVSGCTATVALGTSVADVQFNFAATQTLPAGTYWVVLKGGVNTSTGSDNAGTGSHMYSEDSGSTWSDADQAGYCWRMGVNGCSPE